MKWTSKCGRYTISISESCLYKILEIAKKNYPLESGTSLIGCYSSDGFDAYILDITPLTNDSKKYNRAFVRGIKGLRAFFNKLRKTYKGEKYYIGEWHSHPDGVPVPSDVDDKNQEAIAADNNTNCPEVILLIIGNNLLKNPLLAAYVYSRMKGRITLFPDEVIK